MGIRRRLHPILAAFLLAVTISVAPCRGQEPTPAATPSPQPIPVPEIASRAGEVAAKLRDVEIRLQPDPTIEDITLKLPELSRVVAAEAPGALQILDAQPGLDAIESLIKPWQEREAELRAWNEMLIARAHQLEGIIDELAALNRVWKATKKALAPDTPPAVAERVRLTSSAITTTSKSVKAQRGEVLTMQDGATAQLATIEEVLRLGERARTLQVQNLFSRDTPPITQLAISNQSGEVRARLGNLATAQAARLSEFVRARWAALALHLAGILVLALLLFRAGRRIELLAEEENAWIEIKILELPGSTALVLGLIALPWIHPQAPRVVYDVAGLLALLPVQRLLLHLIGRPLHPWVYALAGFYMIDRLRAVVATATQLEQVIFLGEMLAAVTLLLSLLRPSRLAKIETEIGVGTARLIRNVGPILVTLFSAAFAASALGFGQLARLLGGGGLQSLYLAIGLYAAVRAMEGVVGYVLSTRPLRDLNIIRNHRAAVFLALQRGIRWIAAALWLIGTLRNFALFEAVRQAGANFFSAQYSRGSFTVALGDVFAFALTVWLSFALSRFIRFVLEQDVYPRVRVARGVPYALSRLVHYAVVAIGFLVAAAMIGIDVDRIALLLGAFGVGIGFGLQNIVNNFVSGIILLFERPVQVGNFVQVGSMSGRIERIGIRSSTVRTGDGAEVIVPNATLISEPVTNWTLSDRTRQITIGVGVAYGTDPRRVIDLLETVAEQHSEVMRQPAPRALFNRFADSALEFELQVWTGNFENWSQLRSDISVAIYAALVAAGIDIPYPQREIRLKS